MFAVKDEKEISYMKRSAEASVNSWNYLRKKFVDIVDTEKVSFTFFNLSLVGSIHIRFVNVL
jgi:nucleosome binding factor SPN SPT16 subunit